MLRPLGAILFITGTKGWRLAPEKKPDLEQNPVVEWPRGQMKTTPGLHGARFICKDHARTLVRYATPLYVVLVLVQITDVALAVESTLTLFAITTDPFTVLARSVFAMPGLRAMHAPLPDVALLSVVPPGCRRAASSDFVDKGDNKKLRTIKDIAAEWSIQPVQPTHP